MSYTTPIQRSDRRRDISAGAGQTVFNWDKPLFDAADLVVRTMTSPATFFVTLSTGYTIAIDPTKLSAVVTFALAPRPLIGDPAVTVRLEGRRVEARDSNVTRGGAVASQALEEQLDKFSIVLQEVRRDIEERASSNDILAASAGLRASYLGVFPSDADANAYAAAQVPPIVVSEGLTYDNSTTHRRRRFALAWEDIANDKPFADKPAALAGVSTDLSMSPARVRDAVQEAAYLYSGYADPQTLNSYFEQTGITPFAAGAHAGDANHSPAINAAIDRLITAGGGTLHLPALAGDWKIGSVINLHKTGVTGSYLKVKGVGQRARLKWLNSTGDVFVCGNGATPVYYVQLENILLYSAVARTSGIDLKLQKANIVDVTDVIFDGSVNGIYAEDVNSLYATRCQINMPYYTAGAGATVYSNPAGAGRSDIVKFDEVTVQAYNRGSYGLVCNGRVSGVHTDGFYALGVKRGLQLISASGALSDIPSFCDFRKFEVDRATDIAVVIDNAYRTEFSRCDIANTSGADGDPPQGSADTVAMTIGAGALDTKIIGGRIGNCRRHAVDIQGKNTLISGATITDFAKQGGNIDYGILVNATARATRIVNNAVEGYSRAAAAIGLDASARYTILAGNMWKDCVSYKVGTGSDLTNDGGQQVAY